MFGEGSRLSELVGPSIGGRRLAYGRPLETTVGAVPDDRDGPRKPGPPRPGRSHVAPNNTNNHSLGLRAPAHAEIVGTCVAKCQFHLFECDSVKE
jgi:hypothetical protein